MSSNLFMDVANPSDPTTTLIQQSSLHSNGSCERWKVERQTTGYYLISSECCNRYLSCSGKGSIGNIVLSYYSPSSNEMMLWKFYKTASGNCCIIPKCDEKTCFSLSTQTSNNNLRKKVYLNDNDLSDEWRFYYNAFTIKNYYDSTIVGNNEILNIIENASNFVSYLYENLFQISITVDSAPTFFNNFVSDRCAHGVTALCNFCGANGNNVNCKSLSTVFDQITKTSKTYNQVIVMWANQPGYTIYEGNYSGNPLSNVLGITYRKEDIYV